MKKYTLRDINGKVAEFVSKEDIYKAMHALNDADNDFLCLFQLDNEDIESYNLIGLELDPDGEHWEQDYQ
jgi:hypothetical protein